MFVCVHNSNTDQQPLLLLLLGRWSCSAGSAVSRRRADAGCCCALTLKLFSLSTRCASMLLLLLEAQTMAKRSLVGILEMLCGAAATAVCWQQQQLRGQCWC